MTEEKAQHSTAPANLNELKARIEERGTDWNEALATLKEATGGKDIAAAMRDGWTVEDFWKTLTSDSSAPEAEPDPSSVPQAEPDPTPAPVQNGFTEAPASFNVKAISPGGFDIMLTLRDNDATHLWARAKAALDWLTKNGFTPTPARGGNRRGGDSGNGSGAGSGQYCKYKSDDPGFCPAHGKELKKSKHHPGYYCPAKV